MLAGTVKFFNMDRGYGFIARDDGDDDVFVHISQVDGRLDRIEKGNRVKFEVGASAKSGKPEAKNVELL